MLDGQPLLFLILALLCIPGILVYRRYHAPYLSAQNRSQSINRLKPRKEVPDVYREDVGLQAPLDLKDREVRVTTLFIHPIKSCRGTSVQEAKYTPEGLENDRRWCIITADTHDIVTARDISKMVLIYPHIDQEAGKLIVTFPEDSACETFEVPLNPPIEVLEKWDIIGDCTMFKTHLIDGYVCQSTSLESPSPSEILSKYLDKAVHLVQKGPKRRPVEPTLSFPNLTASAIFQDGFPLLVASEESLERIGDLINEFTGGGRLRGNVDPKWVEGRIEMRRFRPNIVIKGTGVPFAEDVMKAVVMSPHREGSDSDSGCINLVSKCTRCLLPNVDTKTGIRDSSVPYKILMKTRTGKDSGQMSQPCFGVNGVPRGSGVLRVGDFVEVREWAEGPGGI